MTSYKVKRNTTDKVRPWAIVDGEGTAVAHVTTEAAALAFIAGADGAIALRNALGTALGLITKHGLAVELAKMHEAGDGADYLRLEDARQAFRDEHRSDPVREAAPDMLAALKAIWSAYEPNYVSAMADERDRSDMDEAMDAVRAAIAKAEG